MLAFGLRVAFIRRIIRSIIRTIRADSVSCQQRGRRSLYGAQSEVVNMLENITLGQIAAVIAFVVALYGGIKYLKKEVKDAISEMLKDEFKSVDDKLDSDNKRIKELEKQNMFMYKAISLLLQDDLAILEHLRTNNSTGKMAEQEQKVQDFLIQR
mgnify:CR=1 FL=1